MADKAKLEAALEAARRTVEDLEQKRVRAATELERLERSKGPKLQALITGDKAGQRHLRELNTRLVEERLHLEDLDAAIGQAGRRCREIEAEMANANRSEEATAVEALADDWRIQAARADRAMAELVAAFEACHELGMQMRRKAYGSDFNDAFMGPGPRERALHKAGLRQWLPSLGHPLVGEQHIVEYARAIEAAHLDAVLADLRGPAEPEKAEAA